MIILAVDTSTDEASVALAHDTDILAECSWRARGNHSQHLEPVIQRLLALASLDPDGLSAVVAAIGPGSFSGIRVGLSHAMGLAMALSVPLVGVSTLDSIGFQASSGSPSTWALIDAGRGQLFAAHYTGQHALWTRDSDYLVLTPDALQAMVTDRDVLAGPGVDRFREMSERFTPDPWTLRRAGFLAELGRRYLVAGGGDQLHTVQPIYLRRSAAEEKRASSRQE